MWKLLESYRYLYFSKDNDNFLLILGDKILIINLKVNASEEIKMNISIKFMLN